VREGGEGGFSWGGGGDGGVRERGCLHWVSGGREWVVFCWSAEGGGGIFMTKRVNNGLVAMVYIE